MRSKKYRLFTFLFLLSAVGCTAQPGEQVVDGVRLRVDSITFGKYFNGGVYQEKPVTTLYGSSYFEANSGFMFTSINTTFLDKLTADKLPDWEMKLESSQGEQYEPFATIKTSRLNPDTKIDEIEFIQWVFSIPETETRFFLVFPDGTRINIAFFFKQHK